jgi:hypothetical protein
VHLVCCLQCWEWLATAHTTSIQLVVALAKDHLAISGDSCAHLGPFFFNESLESLLMFTGVIGFSGMQCWKWVANAQTLSILLVVATGQVHLATPAVGCELFCKPNLIDHLESPSMIGYVCARFQRHAVLGMICHCSHSVHSACCCNRQRAPSQHSKWL